ncbi:hypothetical protein CC85DRAFT_280774 [Cutaneotrichosporon oleaginosum]|uniref:Uncharacterized protein n=1 Tax=Cutaneotrichosporon oleaginosum TaxID=879819 RepID=A0A0J0XC56_9TREE|nr:uncharacterized protein CC85DRAFT_280774 [Cutaneotrichosporon oleaginosum]KLT38653.1 hypothetical protein CC85DRAFT_280774 [Cutaneotrichosporon oleaginosum]
MSAPARLFAAGTRRAIHSSARRLAETAPPAVNVQGVVSEVPVQKPLLGFSAATALGVYYIQQDSKIATGLLMASVDELQGSTAKITSHLDRLQTVEKDLAALKAAVPQKEDVGKVRGEMKKVYDGLHLELLDLRAHVWGVEQDVQKLAKADSIRI